MVATRPCRVLCFLCCTCVIALGSQGGRAVGRAQGQGAPSQARLTQSFDADWRFSRGDFVSAALPAFDDRAWSTVELPHDWSADGPFESTLGSGNGYAPAGVAWYRKHFTVSADLAHKQVALEFDGVYDHAEVWANGHFVCGRPYGYSSFQCALTPYLKTGTADNLIAVRVDHSRYADSRWYTGSGIYRHVRLTFTEALRVAHWGTSVTTPIVNAEGAVVRVVTTVENASASARPFVLESEVILRGRVVARASGAASAEANASAHVSQDISLDRPERWSIDTPTLYLLRQRVRSESTVTDETETPFGVRSIRFDPDSGFFLNEQAVKLKGVCLHDDAGALGAAVPEAVWERRLRTLKDLGVNAIRTSHNPPAPEFLDLCDRLGLLVKDEAFDEFTPAKNKWVTGWNDGVPSRLGYAESFAEWSVRDVQDMVRRDRNHPAIIMWSIGNEVDYPNDPFTHPVLEKTYRPGNPPAENLVALARPLIEAVKRLDPTRPVTAALASVLMSDAVGLGEMLDIVGYNYQEARYRDDHARYPYRVIFGSENGHQYGNWTIVRDNPYVAGQFLWTGIDYLGEAGRFPNRANGAGLLDLTGFKKPAAWFRQSLWSSKPMVYLCAMVPAAQAGGPPARGVRPEEHWNWPPGSTVTVFAYTNSPEVELTLNGRTQGTRRLADASGGVLTWSVPYVPGILKAVATANGTVVAEYALKTAGSGDHLELSLGTPTPLSAPGIVQVEFQIVDAAGVRVPNADAPVTFEIAGAAEVLAMGNGDLNSIERCKDRVHRTYQGRGLAILRVADLSQRMVIRATAPGLAPATLSVASLNGRADIARD